MPLRGQTIEMSYHVCTTVSNIVGNRIHTSDGNHYDVNQIRWGKLANPKLIACKGVISYETLQANKVFGSASSSSQ